MERRLTDCPKFAEQETIHILTNDVAVTDRRQGAEGTTTSVFSTAESLDAVIDALIDARTEVFGVRIVAFGVVHNDTTALEAEIASLKSDRDDAVRAAQSAKGDAEGYRHRCQELAHYNELLQQSLQLANRLAARLR